MRFISSLVLAGWLAGGIVAPCLARADCASSARHECCCGGSGRCCCLLTANRVPAPSSIAAAFTTIQDLLGPAAFAMSALPAGARSASAGTSALAVHLGRLLFLPPYVASHAYRC